jgi:hypothetical protein
MECADNGNVAKIERLSKGESSAKVPKS